MPPRPKRFRALPHEREERRGEPERGDQASPYEQEPVAPSAALEGCFVFVFVEVLLPQKRPSLSLKCPDSAPILYRLRPLPNLAIFQRNTQFLRKPRLESAAPARTSPSFAIGLRRERDTVADTADAHLHDQIDASTRATLRRCFSGKATGACGDGVCCSRSLAAPQRLVRNTSCTAQPAQCRCRRGGDRRGSVNPERVTVGERLKVRRTRTCPPHSTMLT